MLCTGQVYHYPWYLVLKTSSDGYLLKFHCRRLKFRMLMFITSSPKRNGSRHVLSQREIDSFKPCHSVAKYHKSNGEFGHFGLLCSERARFGIWGDLRGKLQEAERY